MDLFLQKKEYDFAKDTGTEILNLLGYVSSNKIPMRVVVTDGLNELLNIAVSISSFKYYFDRLSKSHRLKRWDLLVNSVGACISY